MQVEHGDYRGSIRSAQRFYRESIGFLWGVCRVVWGSYTGWIEFRDRNPDRGDSSGKEVKHEVQCECMYGELKLDHVTCC